MDDEKLLLAEYKHFSDSFWKNEEVGERRVNFFVTLSAAVFAGIVALIETAGGFNEGIKKTTTLALVGLLLFGVITFIRILRRNQVTDEYKKITEYLRKQMKLRSSNLSDYELPLLSSKRKMHLGGLAESVALMNSFILAVIILLWFDKSCGWLIAIAAFLVSFVLQTIWSLDQRGKARNQGNRTYFV